MNFCNITDMFSANDTFCEMILDPIICWPPTRAGLTVEQQCPIMKGSDPTKTITKHCDENGDWENHNNSNWTNYTVCFTDEMQFLFKQMYPFSNENIMMRIDIAKVIRILEIIGLFGSLIALLFSFVIFYVCKNLRNDRTKIHINLFSAVFITVIVKLTIYIDQLIIGYENVLPSGTGFSNTPWLCEIIYIILEYSKSSTYMWMFIEALHLHNAIAVTATKMSFKKYYLFFGWGTSMVFVVIWVSAMISQPRSHCWWGYNYNPLFWILEGPRIIALLMNTFYLIIIIKEVFIKLRRNTSNEIKKIRKATKATLALLPLLGITNYLTYLEPSLNCSIWYFGFYSFLSYFLNSFQGLFIGLLYCLLNHEVREAVLHKLSVNSFASGSNSLQLQTFRKNHSMDIVSQESAAPS